MQFVVLAEHPPHLCPTANAKTRDMMKQGAEELPALARKLGLQLLTTRVFGGDHITLSLVEAKDIEAVRDFVMQSRLVQWNTVRIYATWSLEEALAKADELPPMF